MLPIYLSQIIETEEEYNKMELLYNQYEQFLYYVAFKFLRDKHRAEDAVHDTFIKIADRLDAIHDVKCPRTKGYLVTIVENICINQMKSKAYRIEKSSSDINEKAFCETVPDRYEETEDRYMLYENFKSVKIALGNLPKKLQNTMTLYALEGYSMREIASIENCSIEAVKKRIQRARAQIIETIKEL